MHPINKSDNLLFMPKSSAEFNLQMQQNSD